MRRADKLRKDSYAKRSKDETVGGSRRLWRLGSLACKHDVHNLLNGDCDRETLKAAAGANPVTGVRRSGHVLMNRLLRRSATYRDTVAKIAMG